MDKSISVLIADDNPEFANSLCEYLENFGGISVCAVAGNGLETVEMLEAYEPDVVILDLIMPSLDGIGVLERVADLRLKCRPVFIVLSAVGHDGIIQKAIRLGADYYLVKPFDIDVLAVRIKQLYTECRLGKLNMSDEKKTAYFKGNGGGYFTGTGGISQGKNKYMLETVATDLIKVEGITPNNAGFYYLREAVVLSAKEPDTPTALPGMLYETIGKAHNISASRVKRAIRSAVNSAFAKMGRKRTDISINELVASLADKTRRILNGESLK